MCVFQVRHQEHTGKSRQHASCPCLCHVICGQALTWHGVECAGRRQVESGMLSRYVRADGRPLKVSCEWSHYILTQYPTTSLPPLEEGSLDPACVKSGRADGPACHPVECHESHESRESERKWFRWKWFTWRGPGHASHAVCAHACLTCCWCPCMPHVLSQQYHVRAWPRLQA